MKLWTCEICNDGVQGPNRLKKSDIRKFCLSCSESYQKMIPRKPCDSKSYKVKLFQSNPEKYIIDGQNLRTKLRDFCLKPSIWKDYFRAKGLPKFRIRYSNTRDYITGCSWKDEHRFCITTGQASDLSEIEGIMIHELSHLFDEVFQPHSETWKQIYCEAVEEIYGFDIDYDGLTIHELDDVVISNIRRIKLID